MIVNKILCVIIFISASISLNGQEIIPFKNQMSEENFVQFTEDEASANEEPIPLEKAAKFIGLAGQSNRLISNELAIIFYNKALEAAIESNSDSMLAAVNLHSCIPFINNDQYEEAGVRLDKALRYFEQSNDTLQLALCYSHIGYLERSKGSNYLALKNIHTAKRLMETQVPLAEMWNVVNGLIISYVELRDFENGIAVGEEFLESTRHLENKPRGYGTILRNTGDMLLQNGEVEKSKPYIEEALPYWMKGRIPKFMTSSYSLLHDLALAEGDVNRAKIYADSSLYYSLLFDSPILQSEAHLRVYELIKQQRRTEGLEYNINRALELAKESKHKTSILNASRAASIFKFEKSDYKNAYNLLYQSDSIRRVLYPEETINSIKQFEKQILQEENQQEIELLNIKNELTQSKLTAASRRNYGLGAGLFIFSCLGWWIYSLYRKTQSQNQIISKALNEKETLLKEIHHRVKNNLQFISSLLRLQTRHVSDDAALDALQEGQDRVQSMALIHQNLYQEDNLTGVDMRAYFRKLIGGLFSSYNIHNDRIQLELDIADLNLDVDTVIPLGLIVNELISNSLKYAFPHDRSGKIKVSLDRQKDTLLLRVEDDGVGISEAGREKMSSSFGYKLINAFTQQLEADMNIDGSSGTLVEFRISNFEVAV